MNKTNSHQPDQKPEKQGFRPAFTSILKPMIYAVLFSLIYSVGYVFLNMLSIDGKLTFWIFTLLSLIWVSLYGLSVYFVCSLVWTKKAGALRKDRLLKIAGMVFGSAAAVNLAGYLCSWLLQSNLFLRLLAALICLFFYVFFVPACCLYFYGVYEEDRPKLELLFRQITESIRRSFSGTVNLWLILFLVLIGWQSLFSGPLSIMFGFDPGALLLSFLYMGEPFCYPVLIAWLSAGTMNSAMGAMIVLDVLFSLIWIWGFLNYILRLKDFFVMDPEEPAGGIVMKKPEKPDRNS